jgi:hypothetical protein
MRTKHRHQWVAGLSGLLLLTGSVVALSAAPAQAFGTINTFGQSAEHEKITRAALACTHPNEPNGECFQPKSLEALAGKFGSAGAVGAPDLHRSSVVQQHCDDGDWLSDTVYGRPYPKLQVTAKATIAGCVEYARTNLTAAVRGAGTMVDAGQDLIKKEVVLDPECEFEYQAAQAKCTVLENFGAVLHGIQDFYSHSNYADEASPPPLPLSATNPPGLGLSAPAAELNLRLIGPPHIRDNLITGCYVLVDTIDGTGACDKHVTHATLNKDKGTINPASGATSGPDTPRGQIVVGNVSNFERAVRGAITETREQWKALRAEIQTANPKTSSLIICAITHDDPIKDCTGRKLAIVIDSSGSNTVTDPGGLRIAAGRSFNAALRTVESTKNTNLRPDRSAVIDFDSSARVISPLDDPSKANFDAIDSDGGTLIASGVGAAISELTKDAPSETQNRSGIVVLTDGQDINVAALVAQVNRADSLGIRVNFGFLSPPANPVPNARALAAGHGDQALSTLAATDAAPTTLTEAILATGGFFATIDSARAQQDFVDVVTQRGATAIDDTNGRDDGGVLRPGLTVTGLATAGAPDTFTYPAQADRALKVTVTTTGTPVTAALVDVRAGKDVATGDTAPTGSTTLAYTPPRTGPLELRVSGGTSAVYTVELEVDQTPTTGTVRFVQGIPDVKVDFWVEGHKIVQGLEYGQAPTVRDVAPGKVHMSARIVGQKLKLRLRGRFPVTIGASTTVTVDLDAQGRPALHIMKP